MTDADDPTGPEEPAGVEADEPGDGLGEQTSEMLRGANESLRRVTVWDSSDPDGDSVITTLGNVNRDRMGPRGCAIIVAGLVVMLGMVLFFALDGAAMLLGLLSGDDARDDAVVIEEGGATDGSNGIAGSEELAFLPRPGVYGIENLPFLPACGPGDLGSGFEEGTITVADDGTSITATGSDEGTAAFDLALVDQSADRLVYRGIEPMTNIELTMVFTSPTTLEATVAFAGDICIERPAVGEWDRAVGATDPDAPPDVTLPAWAPPNFPSGDTRTIDVDDGDSGTFSVVYEDTPPSEVLLLLDEWADANGHVVASFAPGQPEDDPDDGSLAFTAVVELSDGRVMDVDIVDIGGFDTRLTATIRAG